MPDPADSARDHREHPTDELVAAAPELANEQRVPSFLHVVARRAA